MFKPIILICGCIILSSADYEYDTVDVPIEAPIMNSMDTPHYDPATRSLYFIDLFTPNVYRYSEDDDRIYTCKVPNNLQAGFFIPTKDGSNKFVGGFNNSVYTFEWDGVSKNCKLVEEIFSVTKGSNPNMNKGIFGPKESLYTGTVDYTQLCGAPATQRFYRYSRESGLELLPGKYKTTNSLAFDYERNILYHLDGCTQELIAFKVSKTGSICKSWVILKKFPMPRSGIPVGITFLPNGNLYISSYKYGRLFTVDPRAKKIINKEELPTFYAAAIAFGGRGMRTLYVLTGTLDADIYTGQSTGNTAQPPAGQLIIIRGLGKGKKGVKNHCVLC